MVGLWWSFAPAASATAFLSIAAAAEATASDAMDCGWILDGVLDPSRLNIGV